MDLAERYGTPYALVSLDIKRAYDSISLERGFKLMAQKGVLPTPYIRAMRNLYGQARCSVELNGVKQEYTRKVGVAQGGVLSPTLFNAILHLALSEALPTWPPCITPLFYADDILLIATEPCQLQMEDTLQKIQHGMGSVGMCLNPSKCKLMRSGSGWDRFSINGQPMEEVQQLKYLGVMLQVDCKPTAELLARLESGRKTFFSCAKVFLSPVIDVRTKILVYRATVRSVLSYQLSSLSNVGLQMLEAFDRSCLRRIVRGYLPPTATKPYWSLWSNDRVHRAANLESFGNLVRRARIAWAGHVARKSTTELVARVMEQGAFVFVSKMRVGGPRKTWIQTVMDDIGETSIKGWNDWNRIKAYARDREKWKARQTAVLVS